MAFWDTHDAGSGGGGYLTPADKDDLINSGQVFEITAIKYDPEGKFGARWVLTLAVPDALTGDITTRMVGFVVGSGVTSRDDLLQAMFDDHFDAGETSPIPAILAKGGNSILVLPPPGDEA